MPKYSAENFKQAFEVLRAMEQKGLSQREAVESLTSHGFTEGTARIILEVYKRLRRGVVYKRGLSESATLMFLSQIQEVYGKPGLALALQAAELHMLYRAGKGHNLPGLNELIESFRDAIKGAVAPLPGEEIDGDQIEGGRVRVLVSRVERSAEARKLCIAHHGVVCAVCGFSFEKVYGEIGAGFIHVHHLKAVSSSEGQYIVDPVNDLSPLCPNCHAMVHREDPPIPLVRLRSLLNDRAI